MTNPPAIAKIGTRIQVIPAQGGNPACPKLDSRLRGNDGTIAALDAECAVVLNSIRKLL